MYHKLWSYDVWFLSYGAQQAYFFIIRDQFLPFYPPNNPENLNFEKMKKTPGDIIILHKSTVIDNHMMYDSWDMKHSRQNLLFWAIFFPFTFLTIKKIKILKKWKKCLEKTSFYTGTPKIMIICYTFPEIWWVTDVTFLFHFGLFFALLPLTAWKIISKKIMKKTPGDIIILHMCTKN